PEAAGRLAPPRASAAEVEEEHRTRTVQARELVAKFNKARDTMVEAQRREQVALQSLAAPERRAAALLAQAEQDATVRRDAAEQAAATQRAEAEARLAQASAE